MPRRAAELGALAVSRIATAGYHAVGGVAGLYLQVLPTGGRTWILRADIGGRRREMGLGGYPSVTLCGAREAARGARDLIRAGIDPIDRARAAKARLTVTSTQSGWTFRQAGEAYVATHEAGWKNAKHRAQWSSTLAAYVLSCRRGSRRRRGRSVSCHGHSHADLDHEKRDRQTRAGEGASSRASSRCGADADGSGVPRHVETVLVIGDGQAS